jgi:hypothetical protein
MFQDLGRAAHVHDFVTRAISGHATSVMHEHYSSVAGTEVREGLARVISLARFRDIHPPRVVTVPEEVVMVGPKTEPRRRPQGRAPRNN